MNALRWYGLSVAVIALDHATKALAAATLVYGEPRTLLPVLDFTLLHNRGAAFSFLHDAGGWQRWLFAAIAVGVGGWIALWMQRTPPDKRWLLASLALILGGAIGNLIDRVLLGHVVDFISVHWGPHYFPAFNVADSAISVGAAMLVLDALVPERREASA